METAGNERIEQHCMAVALWVTRRARLYEKGEIEDAERADRMIDRLIKELREKVIAKNTNS